MSGIRNNTVFSLVILNESMGRFYNDNMIDSKQDVDVEIMNIICFGK